MTRFALVLTALAIAAGVFCGTCPRLVPVVAPLIAFLGCQVLMVGAMVLHARTFPYSRTGYSAGNSDMIPTCSTFLFSSPQKYRAAKIDERFQVKRRP